MLSSNEKAKTPSTPDLMSIPSTGLLPSEEQQEVILPTASHRYEAEFGY
jgi:hypothetical protein